MAISLIRELSQKQKITLTPQLKKSIDLLQLSRYEIIQKINEEIDINPFLEKIEIDSSEGELNDDFFSSEYEKDVVAQQSLRENLLEQLNDLSLSKDDYLIAESIINSLDDSGELIEGIDEIENLLDFKFSFKKIEKDTKFIFTANKINSILIRITMTFFLFRKIPTMPIVKITAPSVR